MRLEKLKPNKFFIIIKFFIKNHAFSILRIIVLAGLVCLLIAQWQRQQEMIKMFRQRIQPLPKSVLPEKRVELEKDSITLDNASFGTIAQAVGGLLLLITAYVSLQNLKETRKSILIAEEKQLTERFTQAIAQLGSEKITVRCGGVYALERTSKDSKKDYWTIIEILTAFIREESPVSEIKPSPVLKVDVQAAIKVIRFRKFDNELPDQCIDLKETNLFKANFSGVSLRKADLRRANLSCADLSKSDFSEANLVGANLSETSLVGANFSRANLSEVNLSGAESLNTVFDDSNLSKANLFDTDLSEAELNGTKFRHADLRKSNLSHRNLRGLNFSHANLSEADLSEADLTDADLSSANLNDAILSNTILCGARLNHAKLVGSTLNDAHLDNAILISCDLSGYQLKLGQVV